MCQGRGTDSWKADRSPGLTETPSAFRWRWRLERGLAEHLPEALKAEVLHEAFLVARGIESLTDVVDDHRAERLAPIVSDWEQMGFSGLGDGQEVWRETLRTLGRHRRPELMYDLAALAPLIVHLGGPEAIGATFLAIRDVLRWWL